jgi:glycerol kinase
MDLINTTNECIEKAVKEAKENHSSFAVDKLKGVGITNQRETTLVWDAKTGEPLYNAIVWLDNRTTKVVEQLSKEVFVIVVVVKDLK